MAGADSDRGCKVTNGTPNRRICCLASLFRFRRLGPSSPPAEAWRQELDWSTRFSEPSLDELFRDAAMQLLMRRDGITEGEVRALLGEVKEAQTVVSVSVRRRSTATPDARPFPIRFI